MNTNWSQMFNYGFLLQSFKNVMNVVTFLDRPIEWIKFNICLTPALGPHKIDC